MTKKASKKSKTVVAKKEAEPVISKAETVLVLRTCAPDMSSRNGFVWPKDGPVEAPDWQPTHKCGNGLHGWLWGEGDINVAQHTSADVPWLVVEVLASDIIDLGGKVKFPRGRVLFAGDCAEATSLIRAARPSACIIRGTATAGYAGTATAGYAGTATAGYAGTATAGDRGTATAGDSGTATAGYRGTATAGYAGTATAGYAGTATAGDRGTATAGDSGTATAGYRGTATAGDSGTATAGDRGTATAGDSGTATAGYRGTATAGYAGTATAGEDGLIQIWYFDTVAQKYRLKRGVIGESGLLPGTPYKLNEANVFVPVK